MGEIEYHRFSLVKTHRTLGMPDLKILTRAGPGLGRLDAPSPKVFLRTFPYILFAHFLKILTQGHLKLGHQVSSSDPTSKNICYCAVSTVLKEST